MPLERIASFSIDHDRLQRGLYLSRRDVYNEQTIISSFDIRLKLPNIEPALDVPALHTLEHLGATFLRNHPLWSNKIVYFGPMGCRTGLYLVVFGDYTSSDLAPLITEMFDFMRQFTGEIPGASSKECGNYRDQNLAIAKYEAEKFYNETLSHLEAANLNYPE